MKDYSVKEYIFNGTKVRYIIINTTKKVFLQILPLSVDGVINDTFESVELESQFSDVYDWYAGALCHLQLSHHKNSPYSNCYKFSQSYDDMRFKEQSKITDGCKTIIKTVIESSEGYEVVHRLTNYYGENVFEVECEFINNTGKTIRLEAITSASLDGLSPYCFNDNSEELVLHTFRSGWATEGKHICQTIPELNLEKAWGGNFSSIKIGSQGSRPTYEYFPYAVVEDVKRKVMWGIKLAHNGTWQIDFSRHGKDLSISAGLGDCSYGDFFKHIKSGEHFTTPKAYIATVQGDIADISDMFIKAHDRDIKAYGENSMGIIFNEWCTSWGHPNHFDNIRIADKLKKSKTKYFVMDDGWFDGAVGDWEYKKASFEFGLKKYTDEIRKRGMIPGIWMEFECTNEGSKYTSREYDDMHLTRNGAVIYGAVNKSRYESFWDFRNPKTIELLSNKVIDFLKENGFGYLKVDYNANIGIGCDGAESLGEGLRQHLDGVYSFFKRIKEEIPDIIIENCSSGGMRLEPKMMGITAMSSFSDAHECFEFPIVAANLHYLIPPCQSQVWVVLKTEFDEQRLKYTISAGFLGRLCWSGDIANLKDWQMDQLYKAEDFYDEVSSIIRHGTSRIYRTHEMINFRNPRGTQAVIRYSDDGKNILVVYHCFNEPKPLKIFLDNKWIIKKKLYEDDTELNDMLIISGTMESVGNVILLERLTVDSQ